MAYTAPDIKDRSAVGDDQFISEDMGGNKVRLTPAPDEVVESGTDINKALLQPLCDTVEAIDNQTVPAVNKLLPYNLYYWLSRGISGYYSEVQRFAYGISGNYDYVSGRSGIYDSIEHYVIYLFYHRYEDDYEITSCTLQYSNSITISQSDGQISLVNPTTRTFKDSESNQTIQGVLQGKYVKGLQPATNRVFYVPAGSSIIDSNWTSKSYRGYVWEVLDYAELLDGSGPKIMQITSKYNSTNTPWGVISSTEPDTYPASGTVDGTEYIKLGRIDEAFLNYAVNNPTAFQNIATFEARLSALEAAISGV